MFEFFFFCRVQKCNYVDHEFVIAKIRRVERSKGTHQMTITLSPVTIQYFRISLFTERYHYHLPSKHCTRIYHKSLVSREPAHCFKKNEVRTFAPYVGQRDFSIIFMSKNYFFI
uniref:(northern house mosquito) hypothetical protein n=1 Tax=Culex pipiens TaxID=7175 RepID=A0A8D8H2Q0_CULPI